MTDAEWAGENPPPKKKSVPTWLWFCGGGCLLFVIAMVIVAMLAVKEFERMSDPELQWTTLEARLPIDERPAEWEMLGGNRIGLKGWMLQHEDGYMMTVMDFPGAESKEVRRQFFDENFDGSVMGVGGRDDVTVQDVQVQGTTVEVARFSQTQGGQTTSSAVIDVTGEEDIGLLVIMLSRIGKSNAFTDEEIVEFLEPIRLGNE